MNARMACCTLLTAAALAGCGGAGAGTATGGDQARPPDSPAPRDPAPDSPAPDSPAPDSPAPDRPAPEGPSDAEVAKKAAEFKEDYQTAVNVTNTYWQQHWGELFDGTYRAPSLVNKAGFPDNLAGIYLGRKGTVRCGEQVLGPNNAYYCPGEHFVAFDFDFLWRGTQIGDSFVYLIVAHEWGHAVAAHLDREVVGVAAELVADCLAGASLYGAVRDGTLALEEGDVAEITNGLTDVADESPWGAPSDHGDPFDRIRWFDAGRLNGPLACLKTS